MVWPADIFDPEIRLRSGLRYCSLLVKTSRLLRTYAFTKDAITLCGAVRWIVRKFKDKFTNYFFEKLALDVAMKSGDVSFLKKKLESPSK